MKKTMDEFAKWRLQQENSTKPFPYVFPDMPPRFRRGCFLMKTIFLLELVSFGAAAFCICVFCIPMIVLGMDEAFANPFLAFFILAGMAALVFCFVMLLLGIAPRFFWHCPCCGEPFPYYVSRRSRQDMLKRKECLNAMKNLHIRYVQPKFCPLILPSVCPTCRARFFDMGQTESSTAWFE